MNTKFLLWALFMFSCPDPGWTSQAEEVDSMEVKMTNIMNRMTRMEAEMNAKADKIAVLEAAIKTLEGSKEIKDRRIAMLEDDKEVKGQRIAALEDAMETLEKAMITRNALKDANETGDIQFKMSGLEEEMKSLTGRLAVTEEADFLLRGMLDQVRNPPFAFQCAWRENWLKDDRVITYNRLTLNEMSGGSTSNVTGGLDINTGVFTVPQGFSGVWAVTYSIRSLTFNDEKNWVWLYTNGEEIEESFLNAYYISGTFGEVSSLGSRTLYMRLEAGDTVTLRTGQTGELFQITLCFQLAQPDFFTNWK